MTEARARIGSSVRLQGTLDSVFLLELVAFLVVAGTAVFVFVAAGQRSIESSGRRQIDAWAVANRYRLEDVQARPHLLGTPAFDKRQCYELTLVDEEGNRHRAVLRVGSAAFGALNNSVEVLERRPRP